MRGRRGVLAGLALAAIAQGAWADPAMDGRWQGAVNQAGSPGYHVVIVLSGATGRVDYPESHCGGQWTLVSQSNGLATYLEHITYGAVAGDGPGCVDGGTVRVRRQGPVLVTHWINPPAYRADDSSAILHR